MKWIVLSCGLAAALSAMDFAAFKALALERSPQMASLQMQRPIAEQEGDIALMYANPEIEAEFSRFDPDTGPADNGWRASVSQPLRTWGLGDDLQRRKTAAVSLADTAVLRGRAGFIAALERAYTAYVYASKMAGIVEDEIGIARRFETMAKTRYEDGAATRAKWMQATTELLRAQNRLLLWHQKRDAAYYRLLALSGLTRDVPLEAAFLYDAAAEAASSALHSPDVALGRRQNAYLRADAQAKDYALKQWRVYGEYENEPDQAIARIGVSVPLPLFNAGKERAKLARLKAQRAVIETQRTERTQQVRLRALAQLLADNARRHASLEVLRTKQHELLKLFEEGYRLSGSSLLDLLLAKSRLIATRKMLLETRRDANVARIEMNYLQGKYND